jgi:hypothetical protein
MNPTRKRLESLAKQQPKFLGKGGLCVGLRVTQTAKDKGLPLKAETLVTAEGGQVVGLGKGAIQKILAAHGIKKVLAEEGGRTSRGTLGLMKEYVAALNELLAGNVVDIDEAMSWWIEKVHAHFAATGPKLNFDTGKSVRANIDDLLRQAEDAQKDAGGTTYVGAMIQHLVGAKLDLVLGPGKVQHHGFSVADHATARCGDYQVEDLVIHVTTHPSEALARKCADNLQAGLKPMVITVGDGLPAARLLLKELNLTDRVDILDVVQFLTANIYEHSSFQTAGCRKTLTELLNRYNAIVSECETDPTLRVGVAKD